MQTIRLVNSIDVIKKRVLFRVDLNVPLTNNQIINDFRLRSIIPTLDYLINQQATILIVTHIGNPLKEGHVVSTRLLLPWFEANSYSVTFAPDIQAARHLGNTTTGGIIMLENIRAFPGEQAQETLFAQQLAQLADCYVTDAFGAFHRSDASIAITPTFFNLSHKAVGFLVQQELEHLDALKTPEKPFTLILGGAKPLTKIPLIKQFLNTADYILLCPALVFSFLAAQQKPVGNSLIDEKAYDECNDVMSRAESSSSQLLFPLDYVVSSNHLNPPYRLVNANTIGQHDYGVAIGPATLHHYASIIAQSKTIFFNGLMGDLAHKESLKAAHKLFDAMTTSSAKTVVAGGDSVGAVFEFNLQEAIGYISTGGGAALAYLAGQELPGLIAILS